MNWWLVSNGMKHGMITVRKDDESHGDMDMKHEHGSHGHSAHTPKPSGSRVAKMTVFSVFCLIAGVIISLVLT